jgi:hypothetical protein
LVFVDSGTWIAAFKVNVVVGYFMTFTEKVECTDNKELAGGYNFL